VAEVTVAGTERNFLLTGVPLTQVVVVLEAVMTLKIDIEQVFAGRCISGSWDCLGYGEGIDLPQSEETLCR